MFDFRLEAPANLSDPELRKKLGVNAGLVSLHVVSASLQNRVG